MAKGPRGEKRPADVIGNAVHVMKIATGEIEETLPEPGKEYARKGGLIGGPRRAAKLTKVERANIAKKAAQARWGEGQVEAGEKAGISVFTVSKSRKTPSPTPKNQRLKS